MKLALKDFQQEATDELAAKVRVATDNAHRVGPQAVVFAAPTGSGKTVVMTALIERILQGDDTAAPDPDATFLWITDLPELNEQTRDKMAATSNVLNTAFTLRMIDSTFDQRVFDDGKVYFLNTQRLGKDKLLTQRGDSRTFTIWNTVDNTITEKGGRFYLVIDEAHRGMRTKREETEAQTIIQRFLRGTEDMAPAPVVIGVSATPKRFEDLLAGLPHGKQSVTISADRVRASGLLKDRIVLHHLADDQKADVTMLREAANEWQSFRSRWAEYCTREKLPSLEPILVVQVENAPSGKTGTATPLDEAINAINGALPATLPPEAFAHSFETNSALDTGGPTLRYLAPSRIAADHDVRVVFFKTALSTGWDCPRAEVMMSFRKAADATYIAQLIGRMVRTPLARRVERDETLNSVALFLPHYDAEGVKKIIGELQNPEHEYVPPVDVETDADSIVLERRTGTETIFAALVKTPSYMVPSARRVKQTIRLMRLARALARDEIDLKAHDTTRAALVGNLRRALDKRQDKPEFKVLAKSKGRITIGQTVYDTGKGTYELIGTRDVEASPENVDDLYAEAGRRVGEGLHKALWEALTAGIDDLAAIRTAKIHTAVLLADPAVINELEKVAGDQVDTLYRDHIDAIESVGDDRIGVYGEIRGGAIAPVVGQMRMRDRLVWRKADGARLYPKHIFADPKGMVPVKLNGWEHDVISAEVERGDVVGWLRNVDRKDWALQIPYLDSKGVTRPVYPDFLVFREVGGKIVVDIVDPHDPERDGVQIAKGLVAFAEKHGARFGRIEIIIELDDAPRRLDLSQEKLREAIKVVDSPAALRHLYETMGQ